MLKDALQLVIPMEPMVHATVISHARARMDSPVQDATIVQKQAWLEISATILAPSTTAYMECAIGIWGLVCASLIQWRAIGKTTTPFWRIHKILKLLPCTAPSATRLFETTIATVRYAWTDSLPAIPACSASHRCVWASAPTTNLLCVQGMALAFHLIGVHVFNLRMVSICGRVWTVLRLRALDGLQTLR